MNAAEFWAKANQAAASARLLLTAGDTSGACNRAYYAMFDAARAALRGHRCSGRSRSSRAVRRRIENPLPGVAEWEPGDA